MKCEILVTTKDGQEAVGTVSLEGRKLSVEGEEPLMTDILKEKHKINGEYVSAKEDSVAWFKTLPQHYSGVYLRARFL